MSIRGQIQHGGRRRYRAEAIEVDLDSNELLSLVTFKREWITLECPAPQYVIDRFGMVLGQADGPFHNEKYSSM